MLGIKRSVLVGASLFLLSAGIITAAVVISRHPATVPVTVPPETAIHVTLDQGISSNQNRPGDHFQATLAEPVKEKPGLTHFLPAQLTWPNLQPQVRVLRWQGSGDITAMTQANCFALIPADRHDIPAGDTVSVLPRADVL